MEYAHGLDPTEVNALPGQAVLVDDTADQPRLVFTFQLPDPAPEGVIYEVQSSENLQDWTTIATRDLARKWLGPATVLERLEANGRRSVTVEDISPISGRRGGYLRLSVTMEE